MLFWKTQFPWFYAFWKFSRPHTIVGTALSILSLSIITFTYYPPPSTLHYLPAVLLALLTCLCGNLYIVGLNQIEDVSIDRVNKPHLPLASGEFSPRQAWIMVGITGGLALGIALWQGLWLLATVGISMAIGTAYSLPPIRLKRYALWASWCIFTVRGIVVNLGLFLHFHSVLQRSQSPSQAATLPTIPSIVWALTLFILVFTIAIAILKDVPDLEGDRQYRINTLTVRLGQRAVVMLAMVVLTLCYVGMTIAGLAGWLGVHQPFLVTTHLLALVALWWRRRALMQSHNLSTLKQSYARFYQFIWLLFFVEYGLLATVVLLS
jgi:homogentisate phytyltransferase/homogentisate geranylgeranyltransferase